MYQCLDNDLSNVKAGKNKGSAPAWTIPSLIEGNVSGELGNNNSKDYCFPKRPFEDNTMSGNNLFMKSNLWELSLMNFLCVGDFDKKVRKWSIYSRNLLHLVI
jgi:hypothetical protein